MSRPVQSKAQNEANARTLRALVKQPDNKTCADCKRNDPRWASWNIGCFLCIRCSGIHRSMGTHISKVKSIDLDIWTPEQMQSIQKWGNKRSNLYWEAHLKAGHAPPEHKVESFIRSKYETRRWAKEGPPPADPSVLDGGAPAAAPAAAAAAANTPSSSSTSRAAPRAPGPAPQPSAIDLLGGDPTPGPAITATSSHFGASLLDDPAPSNGSAARQTARPPLGATSPQASAPAPAPAPAAAAKPSTGSGTGGGGGLFDLDWHEPPPAQAASNVTSPKFGGKSDILSLFNTPSSTVRSPTLPAGNAGSAAGLDSAFTGLDVGAGSASAGSGSGFRPAGVGAGAGARVPSVSDPWAASTTPATTATSPPAGPAANNSGIFGSADVWGNSSAAPASGAGASAGAGAGAGAGADIWGDFSSGSATTATSTNTTAAAAPKDDPFGDIWK